MLVVGGGDRAARRALRADGARPQAPARLQTVENIGIIFIGLGLALAFRANGMSTAAALAMTAALFHGSTTRCSRACCSSAPARC